MSNDWFRSWHGAPTDHKWAVIAKRANVKPIHVSGTWWALLDHASQHSERGTVDDFDVETFALFAGMEETHVSRIVTTLAEKGLIVDGRIAQWGKRQPKREDETANARKQRERAKNGGKPPRGGGADIPDQSPKSTGHAMSRNVTTDTDKRREDSSVAIATDASVVIAHPAADFAKVIFDSGLSLLRSPDRTDRGNRSIIGRWRKKFGDIAVLDVLRRAEITQPSEPLEWIAKSLETTSVRPEHREGEYRDPILGDAFDELHSRMG